jgi:hypothetical protein
MNYKQIVGVWRSGGIIPRVLNLGSRCECWLYIWGKLPWWSLQSRLVKLINKLFNYISYSVGLTCNSCRALAQTASSAPNFVTVLSPNVIHLHFHVYEDAEFQCETAEWGDNLWIISTVLVDNKKCSFLYNLVLLPASLCCCSLMTWTGVSVLALLFMLWILHCSQLSIFLLPPEALNSNISQWLNCSFVTRTNAPFIHTNKI